MSFLSWLRNAISGPPHVGDGGDPEAAADLHDEYGVADDAAADVKHMAETGGGGGYVRGERYGAAEAAEAAEEDLESEQAPPDLDP